MQAFCLQSKPQVFRIIKAVPATRQLSNMSFFPRAFASEFAPVFRLLDDYASHAASRQSAFATEARTFQPKFDVKENKDNYELHGELPGVQRDNLTIEFTDSHTLAIKGRTETVREEGTRPAEIEDVSAQATIEGAESGKENAQATSGHYRKPSVEDENAVSGSTFQTGSTAVEKRDTDQTVSKPQQQSRYWLSERSVGTFARSFQFPTRVDQDNVKASLENGILSIVIPKATAPQSKRINIE